MSSRVPGPNARSHFLTSSARATSTDMSAMPSGSQRSIGLQRNWLAIQRATRAAACDPTVQCQVEEDLLADADRGLVRLASRDGHLLAEAWVERPQLRGGRLTSLADGGEPDLLELRKQGGRVRSDPRLREHGDRPLALGLGDAPARRRRGPSGRRRPAPGTAFGASRARAGRFAPRTTRVRSRPATISTSAPWPAGRRSANRMHGSRRAPLPPRPPTRPVYRQQADAARPPEPGARRSRCEVSRSPGSRRLNPVRQSNGRSVGPALRRRAAR